jgi:uncharacterized protein YprB with RNaseH-like and TPR domain
MALSLKPVIIDIETTGLDPFTDRIVAIGVWRGPDVKVFIDEKEHRVIWDFFKFLTAVPNPLKTQCLIGYNIQNFDIPFITARAIKHGHYVDAGYLRRMYRADLINIITRYMNTRNRYLSLKAVADFLDIEVNDSVSGSDIPRLWEERNLKSIIKHCLSDLSVTAKIFKNLCYLVEHNIERRYELDYVSLVMEGL